MSYYHTCPDCKANLDPGERCDCEKINRLPFEDRLIIGFDNAKNTDHTVLMISRIHADKIEIINSYLGDEARDMYSKLITQAPEGKVKLL